MRRIEYLLELGSPLIGILIVIVFHYLFPDIVKTKGDTLLLIGISLSVYGISLAALSTLHIRNLRHAPGLIEKLRATLDELGDLRDAEMVLPAEVCLQREQTVKQTVHVLTHDLSWNIDEGGTPRLMFETIVFNLKRGIVYEYIVMDPSEGTKQNLALLRRRLEERLQQDASLLTNFKVRFIESFPLLFSFALFDMSLPGRVHHGFILVHTLDKPMSIPMNLATFAHARDILNTTTGLPTHAAPQPTRKRK
jgi:hypothetical protein